MQQHFTLKKILHYLLFSTFIVFVAFVPVNWYYTYRIYILPLILCVLWLAADGCPWNKPQVDGNGRDQDIANLLQHVFNITEGQAQTLVWSLLITSLTIAMYRLQRHCQTLKH